MKTKTYVLLVECVDAFRIHGNQSHPPGGIISYLETPENLPELVNVTGDWLETYTHRLQYLFQSLTFIVLLAGEPEASVEVPQHVLVLASLPDVVNSVGQLLPFYPSQFLLLHRR